MNNFQEKKISLEIENEKIKLDYHNGITELYYDDICEITDSNKKESRIEKIEGDMIFYKFAKILHLVKKLIFKNLLKKVVKTEINRIKEEIFSNESAYDEGSSTVAIYENSRIKLESKLEELHFLQEKIDEMDF